MKVKNKYLDKNFVAISYMVNAFVIDKMYPNIFVNTSFSDDMWITKIDVVLNLKRENKLRY